MLAGHRSQQARFALDLVERDGIVASPAGITRSRAASASSTRRGRVFMAWMIFIHAVNWQSHVAKAHPVRLPAIRVAHRCAKRRGRRAPARFMDNWPPALLHLMPAITGGVAPRAGRKTRLSGRLRSAVHFQPRRKAAMVASKTATLTLRIEPEIEEALRRRYGAPAELEHRSIVSRLRC